MGLLSPHFADPQFVGIYTIRLFETVCPPFVRSWRYGVTIARKHSDNTYVWDGSRSRDRLTLTALNRTSRSGRTVDGRHCTPLPGSVLDPLTGLLFGCLSRPTTVRRLTSPGLLHPYHCNTLRLRPPSQCRDRLHAGRPPPLSHRSRSSVRIRSPERSYFIHEGYDF